MNELRLHVPILDLKAQYISIREEIESAIQRVLESQNFILGPEVQQLEEEIAAYSQAKYGVGVSSGTDALLVALMVLNVKPGDEVITTTYTFFATVGAIVRLGATPIFVDIDPFTYNINPQQIRAKITSRTKAIIPVHLYGQVANMDSIIEIAQEHNLIVIEDAAQAIGAEYNGKRAGSIGHMGCFSFFPSKNLGGIGDGGMVITNSAEFNEKLKLFRNHGYKPKYYNAVIGGNFRLDAIQAAVLSVKLKYLDSWTQARQRNAQLYRQMFAKSGISVDYSAFIEGQQGIVLPKDEPSHRHIYNQFIIRCSRRDELLQYLKEQGVTTEIYYPVPMHLQECFQYLGYQYGNLPGAEHAAIQTLALPIYPELTEDMLSYVVENIKQFYTIPLSAHGA